MADPISALAAQEAVSLGASLLAKGVTFGRRVRNAPDKALRFEKDTAAAQQILNSASLSSPDLPQLRPHVDGLRDAVVEAQKKQEYDLKRPEDGNLKKLSVARAESKINELDGDVGRAVQNLHAGVGLSTLHKDAVTQIHDLVQTPPEAWQLHFQQQEHLHRQWLQQWVEERLQQQVLDQQRLMQQIVNVLVLEQQQQHQRLHDLLRQASIMGAPPLPDRELLHRPHQAPALTSLGTAQQLFTFLANFSGSSDRLTDLDNGDTTALRPVSPPQWLINGGDLPPCGRSFLESLTVLRYKPGEPIYRFELHVCGGWLSAFLPELYSSAEVDLFVSYWEYAEAMSSLMHAIGPNIMPHASSQRSLVLELGHGDSPAEVRCLLDSAHALRYPSTRIFDTLRLQYYDEREISRLDKIAGWVFSVTQAGRKHIMKSIVSRAQVASFEQEIFSLARLQAVPHVVKLHGLVTCLERAVVKGMLVEPLESLTCIIEDLRGLEQLKLAVEIAQVVADLHNRGIIIGEIVADQFGLNEWGEVKLLGVKRRGFRPGYAPPEAKAEAASTTSDSPEWSFGPVSRWISIKSDIWQLGRLLLSMATNREYVPVGTMCAACDDDLTSPTNALDGPQWSALPEWAAFLVEACLAIAPEDRWFASRIADRLAGIYERLASTRSATHTSRPSTYGGDGRD